ncbi:hypothetical protein PYCC9005_003862 [Savitreella phatthalungensis]
MLASPAQLKAMSPIHVLRGAQLALLGIARAVQNPQLYTSAHYRQLGALFLLGIVAHLVATAPLLVLRVGVRVASLAVSVERRWWETDLVSFVSFIQHWVLTLPFLMLDLLRSLEPAPFDDVFMLSLRWCDGIYLGKHDGRAASNNPSTSESTIVKDNQGKTLRPQYAQSLGAIKPTFTNTFMKRTLRRSLMGLAIYAASFVPYLGKLVLPALSFYTLNKSVGVVPAGGFMAFSGLILPRHYTVVILQTYLGTRALTRQLLQPYFARVGRGFTKYQRGKWYREREGVLFGFALPFFLALRLPYIGILAYGLASASAAFVVTKVTRPPQGPPAPEPITLQSYAEDECLWTEGRRNLVRDGWEVVSQDYERRKADLKAESSELRKDIDPADDVVLVSASASPDPNTLSRATFATPSSRSRKSSTGSSDAEWIKLADSGTASS